MPISGKEMLRRFLKAGWELKSQNGSHMKVEKGGEIEIIPNHKELKKGTESDLFKSLKNR